MADVYTVTFSVIGLLLTWPALLITLNLLFPSLSKRMAGRLGSAPGTSFMVGLPATAVLVFLILVAFDNGSGLMQAAAFLTAGFLFALWMLGSAGFARLLGGRMGIMAQQSELKRLAWGAMLFVLAMLFPVIGWFFFLPVTGIMAVGSAVSSVRLRRKSDEERIVVEST